MRSQPTHLTTETFGDATRLDVISFLYPHDRIVTVTVPTTPPLLFLNPILDPFCYLCHA